MSPEDLEQIRGIVRQEVTAAEQRIAAQIQTVIAETRAAIKAAEERSQEFARDIESNLLRAYHSYSESN